MWNHAPYYIGYSIVYGIALTLIFKMAAIIVNDQNGVFRGSNFFMHSLFLLIFVSNER